MNRKFIIIILIKCPNFLKNHCSVKFQYVEITELQVLGEDLLGKHGILDKLGKLEVGDIPAQENNTKKQDELLWTLPGTQQAF